MGHLNANEMAEITQANSVNPEKVNLIVTDILDYCQNMALNGKYEAKYRGHGFANSILYNPRNETPEQLAVMDKLKSLGYEVKTDVVERQFVDLFLSVKWNKHNQDSVSQEEILSDETKTLKSNLEILEMDKAQKALDLVIEEMGDKNGFTLKDGVTPFYEHIVYTATTLLNLDVSDEKIITASMLHDAVDNIDWITYDYIEKEYGVEISHLIKKLTFNKN